MSDNIIDFNETRLKMMEEKFDRVVEDSIKEEEFIKDFSMSVARDVVDAMDEFGYDVTSNPDCIKDLIALIEATEALLQRASGVETSFQKISNHLFLTLFETDDTKKILDSFLDSFDG